MRTTTPRVARVLFYGFFAGVLLLILFALMTKVVPGKTGVTISRISEGFLTLLVVALWIDVVRPRLTGRRLEWVMTVGAGLLLLTAGLVLRQMPWPSRIVTLNEALIGLSVLVVYLQLRRPVSRWWLLLPAVAVVVPVMTSGNEFTVDMAEAFGAWVLIPLVVDVVDRGLLRGRPPVAVRNIAWAVGLLVFIEAVHLMTPKSPVGTFGETTYYIQRATEMFIASAALLLYYAVRRPRSSRRVAANPAEPVSERA